MLKSLAQWAFPIALFGSTAWAASPKVGEIATFIRPFASTKNLSGSVLIMRGRNTLFTMSYGYADRDRRILNGPDTRFHIASMSILFTSTAILRLIDQGKLSFDTRISDIVPGIPNGDRITIGNLLLQNSGLPDINDDLPDATYQQLINSHQTPESLIDAVRLLPPHGEPGGEPKREEHTGQNLLALIIEKKTGVSFADAMQRLVFQPFGMRNSGIDDDRPLNGEVARGYQVTGTFGLRAAPTFHWSAKPGNGSAYTTVTDEWKWLQTIVQGPLLSERSRKAMLETENGFGWIKSKKQTARLGENVLISNGRAPGFSAILEYLPADNLAVIVLTNIEHDANPLIIPELTAIVMGEPYKAFNYKSVPAQVVGGPAGNFVFGPDFYRRSATLSLVTDTKGTTLYWPGGPEDPLLPIGKDKFVDRYYWNPVKVERGAGGKPIALEFGEFRGLRH
jgi:CubicO group peptidase (beta-lactamase class C family)